MQQELEVGLIATLATTGEVQTASADIPIATTCTTDVIDITDRVGAIVRDTGIIEGLALISAPHTTCAIIVNEAEPGFLEDFKRALEAIAPQSHTYAHNDAPHAEEFEAPNGYAHVRAAFLSSHSTLLPVRNGSLALGRWQRIFFVELDRARPRTCQVTLVGRAR
ncbi:MAG TPA: secondary thiamine-phosphate synthase enzyme YjbQ [Actinomycetota bacterium]|nr:secondary thiamine-phosphate synthase enzyme YjbQ [Actinomycetota bacterium]